MIESRFNFPEFFTDSLTRASRTAHAAGSVMLGGAVLLLLAEMIARRIFGVSITIAEEYAGYFCAGVVFLGAARTLVDHHHIRSDLVVTALPGTIRRAVECLAAFCSVICSGYLVIGLGSQWWDVWTFQSRSFFPSRTPLWLPLIIPLFGMSLYMLIQLTRAVRSADRKAQSSGATLD